jgi:hypothetical protein
MKQRPVNRDRANRVGKLLAQNYEGATDWAATITDALADIRHLCDKHDLDLGDLDRIAHDHYLAERWASDAEAQDSERMFNEPKGSKK